MTTKTASLLAVLLLGLAAITVRVALALLVDSAPVAGNSFSGDTLTAPTNVTAAGGASVVLNWTPTTDTYASGHRVFRATASGGPYSQIAQVTPRTTATYTDNPGAGSFYYVLRAYYQSWESVDSSQVSSGSTGYRDCGANAPVTSGSGDNNGFETTPANACTDGGGSAQDANSGTGSGTSCTATGKDRHMFYNYGFTVPAGSTINGIEVRLDALVTSTGASTRRMCAQLSWNGGTTWTTAQQLATNLTTSEVTYVLGAPNDTWGRTWSVSELSDANFRLRVTDVANNTSTTFQLDWAAVRVTYTPP